MALVKCPECGREKVSDSAEACPDCGFNIKKYFTELSKDVFFMVGFYSNQRFEFLDGFSEGVNGQYCTLDKNRGYFVKDGLVYLPGGDSYTITDKCLLEVTDRTKYFEGTIPDSESFDAVIYEQTTAQKSKWIFSKDGIVRNDDGEKGFYKRRGDFLIYKMSNSSSMNWRNKSQIFFVHDNMVYRFGFVKEKYLDEVVELKNEVEIAEYPFAVSVPLESNDYSYSTVNVPKCPTCQSTNLKKITGLSKAGSVAMWGIFAAGRTSKTWHCNNCGSEW